MWNTKIINRPEKSEKLSEFLGIMLGDGCIYVQDMRKCLIALGFHPSKIICNTAITLSRQDEIKRYVEEIGFNNLKHINRIKNLAPSSSGQEDLKK